MASTKKPLPEGPFEWKVRSCRVSGCNSSVVFAPEAGHPTDGKYWRGSMDTPLEASPHTGKPLEYTDHLGPWRAQAYVRTFDGDGNETEPPMVQVLRPGEEADPDEPIWWAHRGSCRGATAQKWRKLHPAANARLPW